LRKFEESTMLESANNIVLVTFDNPSNDYQRMPYSIASIIATLKNYDIKASHYSFNIKGFYGLDEKNDLFINHLKISEIGETLNYFKKFSYIAIGVTRWSENQAYMLVRALEGFNGKIIVGGYEITAMTEDNPVSKYLNIDYFIKGYAEKPLVKIIQGKYPKNEKFIREDLDPEYLFSPYSEGILNAHSRKIYWETKRGCTYDCGFCEWGNAQAGMVDLKSELIDQDIEIFSGNSIEEINILDATFNIQKKYREILKKLIIRTNAIITFQARFETLSDDFLQFCAEHKDRLHLEFGLQTIHQNEMNCIGRKNKISLISEKLNALNEHDIDYETSIIYAIPGQTTSSFIDTIEYLRVHGCNKIMAYPLQIPSNSELHKRIKQHNISFKEDIYNVKSVDSCDSFDSSARSDMDRIVYMLTNSLDDIDLKAYSPSKIKGTQFQYEITQGTIKKNRKTLERIISNKFMEIYNALYVRNIPFEDTGFLNGLLMSYSSKEILDYALGKKTLVLEHSEETSNPIEEFHFKVVFGESGHVYIYREKKCNTPILHY
jgi:radical SAM superfamily enzyme YgiQ (UPF0313 family)